MEITRKFPVSQESFMNHIRASIAHDLEQSQLKSDKVYEGLEYDKELSNRIGNSGRIKVKITKLDDKSYSADFYGSEGINRIHYEVTSIDEDRCQVYYHENFIGKTNTKQLNFKLMSALYKRANKKRINLLFDNIEKHLTEEKNNG